MMIYPNKIYLTVGWALLTLQGIFNCLREMNRAKSLPYLLPITISLCPIFTKSSQALPFHGRVPMTVGDALGYPKVSHGIHLRIYPLGLVTHYSLLITFLHRKLFRANPT